MLAATSLINLSTFDTIIYSRPHSHIVYQLLVILHFEIRKYNENFKNFI